MLGINNLKFDDFFELTLDKRTRVKGAMSRNSAKLGNYKMPVKLRET